MAEMTAAEAIRIALKFNQFGVAGVITRMTTHLDGAKQKESAYKQSVEGKKALIEQQAAEIERAKATIDTHSELAEHYKKQAEQTEAQAAAMRLQFEKYVRENCKLIRHSVADGLDKPDDVDGKCGGYCQNFDEPHQICQECIAAYDPEAEYNDEVADAGTAILAENKRMREALEEIRRRVTTCNTPIETVHAMDNIARAALEGK